LHEKIAEANQSNPDTGIVLVDFSGFCQYNCERIPALHEVRASNKWYWEAGHFKKALGDIARSAHVGKLAGKAAIKPSGWCWTPRRRQ
jgi:hypothetical protein